MKIEDVLGPKGGLLSASKGRYRYNHPEHLIIFNAVIVTKKWLKDEYMQVWRGDLDISDRYDELVKASKLFRHGLYVLRDGLDVKDYAAYIKDDEVVIGESLKEYYEYKTFLGSYYVKEEYKPKPYCVADSCEIGHTRKVTLDDVVDSLLLEEVGSNPFKDLGDQVMEKWPDIESVCDIGVCKNTAKLLNLKFAEYVHSEHGPLDDYEMSKHLSAGILCYAPVYISGDDVEEGIVYRLKPR